jgi:DNA-binding CsgD family transcriptional regulator
MVNKPVSKVMAYPTLNHYEKNKLLTPRQVEILAWVAIGATDAEIAEKLGISPSTVKGHLNKIFKKINAPNRRQAIFWALDNLQYPIPILTRDGRATRVRKVHPQTSHYG